MLIMAYIARSIPRSTADSLPASSCPNHSPARGLTGLRRVTFGKSRVRESRSLGSVGAKVEWLSYPTNS